MNATLLFFSRRFLALLALGMGLAALGGAALRAADPAKERVVVAKALTLPGTFLARQGPDKPWHPVLLKGELFTNDLIVGTPGAILETKNGAVRLAFLTDFEDTSPFPIRECAVILHQVPEFDLAFTLDRGRCDVVNRKEKGGVHVRVRVRNHIFDMTLTEPGTRVALELYGRWPKGVPFSKDPKPENVPLAEMVILVIKGEVELKHGGCLHALHAPPGPALMRWDSAEGGDTSPTRLEKAPEWATVEENLTAERKARLEKLRMLVTAKTIGEGLDKLLESDNTKERKLALSAMAALDDIPRLAKFMATAKHPDVLDNGILTLRHWIGRGPGQDQKLYQMFIDEAKFTPVHAAIAMQLLHSFGDEELARPETYELLIEYLDHERTAIRAFAHWHLVRLAPSGRKIAYNPLDPKDKRAAGIAEWKKLIPPGQLPPKEKPAEK